MAWRPKNFELELDNDLKNKGEDDRTNEYDCSQLTENFGARNLSAIHNATDQSSLFLNDSKFIAQ